MGSVSLASSAVDAYREEADRFLAALDEEHYLHLAGHKGELELAPIYERYADLTSLDACRRLRASVDDGVAPRELWRFACEGYLGELTREETEEVARLEASLTVEVDGDAIPFRLTRPRIANEPDRERRERLERARAALVDEHLNSHYARSLERVHAAAQELGAATYGDLYERFGFRLAELAPQCERILDVTEDAYVRSMDRLFRARVGIALEDARRSDLLRLFRAADWDAGFPADAMLPALIGTLADLGIDLEGQENVELDLEPRPKKSPRAFCAPIEIPDRVLLVIQPIGGPDDWHALFHEAGHTEHYAHTSADLPMEARRLGDNAVTEGWAALFELLVDDPAWLARRLDFGRPDQFAAESAATRLFFVRRYAAKLLYELELHRDGELDGLRRRYVELLGDATKIVPSDADFLADVDPGFYASCYIRSWAFESQMQAFLREEFGSTWFTKREAGSLLRELWSEGQRLTADELVRELTGSALDLEAIVERTREPLRA
jgi:hypothetical protein